MIIVQQDNELYKHEDGEGWIADGVLSITSGSGEMIAMYSRWDWVKTFSKSKDITVNIEGTIDPATIAAHTERAIRNKAVWR